MFISNHHVSDTSIEGALTQIYEKLGEMTALAWRGENLGKHLYVNGKCVFCGGKESKGNRGKRVECKRFVLLFS